MSGSALSNSTHSASLSDGSVPISPVVVSDPKLAQQDQASSGDQLDVTDIVHNLCRALDRAVVDILKVNSATKVLALNARIEASRAAEHGSAFGVVAQEMQRLSERTSEIAERMSEQTQRNTQQLLSLIGWHIRGRRLSDLALTNIDLIDRCLYERTCDVRWWATDSAVVDALQSPTVERLEYAFKRLGVILKAYTVYYDLVLADQTGVVQTNGHPDLYNVVHRDESRESWFLSAMRTSSGDEFGFQVAQRSPLVGNSSALIYSAAVRENGEIAGRILGALGILFNWSSLSRAILNKTAHSEPDARCYIIDDQQNVLASNDAAAPCQKLDLPEFNRILSEPQGYFIQPYQGKLSCIAFAAAPGFETYSTGWYSVIIQPVPS